MQRHAAAVLPLPRGCVHILQQLPVDAGGCPAGSSHSVAGDQHPVSLLPTGRLVQLVQLQRHRHQQRWPEHHSAGMSNPLCYLLSCVVLPHPAVCNRGKQSGHRSLLQSLRRSHAAGSVMVPCGSLVCRPRRLTILRCTSWEATLSP